MTGSEDAGSDRRTEAIEALRLNVASTNKRLRDIIAHIVGGSFTSPALRETLEQVRKEFIHHRASWVVIGSSDLLQRVEHWHDQIRSTKDDIFNEEDAWMRFMNTSPVHPPEILILPAKKRIGEYQALLATGEALEAAIKGLLEPRATQPQPPSAADAARSRLATRLLLLKGQFDTLSHWLRGTHGLHAIDSVLVDIEKLSEGQSHSDLDEIGDPELGKIVIAFHRDVRGAVQATRDVADSFNKHRPNQSVPSIQEAIQQSLTLAQAHAAQCSRQAQTIAEQVKPGSTAVRVRQ